MSKQRFTVHELGELVGRSASTIRRYERAGFIDPPARDLNGWRSYGPQDVERVRRVVLPQEEGTA